MECLYLHDFTADKEIVEVEGEEAKHLKSLRAKLGKKVGISNGKGILAVAYITDIKSKSFVLQINKTQHFERTNERTLIFAQIDNRDRLEFTVEKATELGFDNVLITKFDRSSNKTYKTDRLQSKAIAALKQCQNPFLPKIEIVNSLENAIKLLKNDTLVIFGNQFAKSKVNDFASLCKNDLALVIGPEGDYSEEEFNLLRTSNSVEVSINKNRLRSETAAIAMMSIVKSFDLV